MVKITNIAITKKLSGAGFFDKKVFLPDIEALPI
jgi:hypothetical protein